MIILIIKNKIGNKTPCSLVEIYQYFAKFATCIFNIGRSSVMKKETCYFQNLVLLG